MTVICKYSVDDLEDIAAGVSIVYPEIQVWYEKMQNLLTFPCKIADIEQHIQAAEPEYYLRESLTSFLRECRKTLSAIRRVLLRRSRSQQPNTLQDIEALVKSSSKLIDSQVDRLKSYHEECVCISNDIKAALESNATIEIAKNLIETCNQQCLVLPETKLLEDIVNSASKSSSNTPAPLLTKPLLEGIVKLEDQYAVWVSFCKEACESKSNALLNVKTAIREAPFQCELLNRMKDLVRRTEKWYITVSRIFSGSNPKPCIDVESLEALVKPKLLLVEITDLGKLRARTDPMFVLISELCQQFDVANTTELDLQLQKRLLNARRIASSLQTQMFCICRQEEDGFMVILI